MPPKQLLKAQAHYFASVATRADMASNIMEMSDFMKTRFDRAADEYRYAVDEIVFQKGAIQTVKDFTMKHAYVLQTTIQRPMEMISGKPHSTTIRSKVLLNMMLYMQLMQLFANT